MFNRDTGKWDAWGTVKAANERQAHLFGCWKFGRHWVDVSVRLVGKWAAAEVRA